MMNHQRANGRPTQRTIAFAMSGTFMYIGGSLGPAGTRSKKGPVIHRIHTYNWRTRIAPPTKAQICDRLDLRLDLGAERGRSAERLGDSGHVLAVRQIRCHASPSFGTQNSREYTNWYLTSQ